MKLVLASCTADVYLYVDHLPVSGEDVTVTKRTMKLGGCGYQVAKSCPDSLLVSPLGTGAYGTFVKENILKEDIDFYMPQVKEESGACFCLIEPNGERTFLANHGAEYRYSKEMLEDLSQAEWIYISGIDLEEKGNQCLIDHCARSQSQIFFAPGPRVGHIRSVLGQVLFLDPVLHMNKEECETWTKKSFQEGMKELYAQTHKPVIVTDSIRGSYAFNGSFYHVEATPVVTKNATGAGDTHAATCLDLLSKGISLPEILKKANEASAHKIQEKENE